MKRKIIAILVATAAVAVAGCGSSSSADAPGNSADRAFVADMIPHHQSAIDMAKIAQQRGQSRFVKTLAGNIIKAQDAEIAIMKREDAGLAKADIEKGDLGMDDSMMGMDMNMNTQSLKTANPFDRAFLSMMTPHHKGALTMAKAELDKGKDPQLKALAKQIIAGQTREIRAMQAHLSS